MSTSTKIVVPSKVNGSLLRKEPVYTINYYNSDNYVGIDKKAPSRNEIDGLIGLAKRIETATNQKVKLELVGKDLSTIDLSGLNLSEADIRGSDLRGASLKGTNFYGADLRYSKVLKRNLVEGCFNGADTRHIMVY